MWFIGSARLGSARLKLIGEGISFGEDMLDRGIHLEALRSSTCGNMLSAVAYSSFTNSLIPFSRLFSQISSLRSIPSSPTPGPPPPITYPIRILSANTGKVLTARVPIDALTMKVWDPPVGKGVKIAGVPGEAAGIELEFPIESEVGAGEGGLMTGRERDVVTIDGKEVSVCLLEWDKYTSGTNLPLSRSSTRS